MKKILWILIIIFVFFGLAFLKEFSMEEKQAEKLSSYSETEISQDVQNP